MLDTTDPYTNVSVKRFSAGNVLNVNTDDTPSTYLGEAFIADPGLKYGQADAFYGDDQFEMYLIYFTGSNPSQPSFQRPLALTSLRCRPVRWRTPHDAHTVFRVNRTARLR